jgi:putative heme iron utilization protein
MTSETPAPDPRPSQEAQQNQASSASLARSLVRKGRKAFLGTVDKSSGHPHVSLVIAGTEPDGSPVLLISRLAVHTQNLTADARCSLLFDGTDLKGDPLAGGRVTVIGTAKPTASETARRRFLARHPEAEGYASFADFSFYAIEIERAHFIGGFGRIVTLPGAELLIDTASTASLVEGEPGIVEHMNEDHLDAIQLYAAVLAGREGTGWRMIGIDPEGFDLSDASGQSERLCFAAPVTSPADARRELVRLVGVARAGADTQGGPAN